MQTLDWLRLEQGLLTGVTGEALEPRRERDPLPPTAEDDEDVDDIQHRNAIVSERRRRLVIKLNKVLVW